MSLATPAATAPNGKRFPAIAALALGVYLCSTCAVIVGVLLPRDLKLWDFSEETIDRFARRDGQWYLGVLRNGYEYTPAGTHNVAFFPAYPLTGRAIARALDIDDRWALFLVSQACLLVSFLLLAAYAAGKFSGNARQVSWVLVVYGFFPTTFFFRMMYAESMFVCACLVVLLLIQRNASPTWVLLACGLATAIRPVGVAVLPVVVIYGLRTAKSRAGRAMFLLGAPIAAGGLIAFAIFLWISVGDPLAFAHVQQFWNMRPVGNFWEKLTALATLEPFWSVFVPSSPAYWRNGGEEVCAISLRAANPLIFGCAIVAIWSGFRSRILNIYEIALSGGLLLISYLTRSYEMCMLSHGRFAAVVVPAYLVYGHWLEKQSPAISTCVVALGAILLVAYAMMFSLNRVYI